MDKAKYWVSNIMFRGTLVLWIIILKFFLKWEVVYRSDEALKIKKGPVLVAMNHVSWADPFVGGSAIPNVFPIRYITKKGFFKHPVLGIAVRLYGCIKLEKETNVEEALKEPLDILQKSGTVGIFPEGKIRKNGRPRKARQGAGYLAKKSNAVVIPVYIDGLLNMNGKELLSRKRHAVVYVGKPFFIPADISNFREASAYIMSRVKELK